MSFDINVWLNEIIDKVKAAFGERLLFIGLQGSYNRCEATSDSDIDLVVVIDELTFNDIKIYKKIVAEMPYSNKACGFFALNSSISYKATSSFAYKVSLIAPVKASFLPTIGSSNLGHKIPGVSNNWRSLPAFNHC